MAKSIANLESVDEAAAEKASIASEVVAISTWMRFLEGQTLRLVQVTMEAGPIRRNRLRRVSGRIIAAASKASITPCRMVSSPSIEH